MTRRDQTFLSGGQRCFARLRAPDTASGPSPCLLMAQGLDGAGHDRLEAFAERFVGLGVIVLSFDYRHFGDSEGEPRGLVDRERQLEDWRAAITFARMLQDIDSRRLALWGTALSGGHVAMVAAEDPGLAAVISQAPFVDGLATLRAAGPRKVSRLAAAQARGQRSDRLEGNLLRLAAYRPGIRATAISSPWLVCVCDRDALLPPRAAARAAARAPHAELRRYDAGHDDIYAGPAFEAAVTDQAEFLRRHLLG